MIKQTPISSSADTTATIIALEKSALDKWNQGDPEGYLDLYAEDIVYIDPYIEQPLNGLEAMEAYYEPIKGLLQARYELLNPIVLAVSDMAVLSFQLISYEVERVVKWNCTEVYRLEPSGQWKIIQSHWSFIKPDLKS